MARDPVKAPLRFEGVPLSSMGFRGYQVVALGRDVEPSVASRLAPPLSAFLRQLRQQLLGARGVAAVLLKRRIAVLCAPEELPGVQVIRRDDLEQETEPYGAEEISVLWGEWAAAHSKEVGDRWEDYHLAQPGSLEDTCRVLLEDGIGSPRRLRATLADPTPSHLAPWSARAIGPGITESRETENDAKGRWHQEYPDTWEGEFGSQVRHRVRWEAPKTWADQRMRWEMGKLAREELLAWWLKWVRTAHFATLQRPRKNVDATGPRLEAPRATLLRRYAEGKRECLSKGRQLVVQGCVLDRPANLPDWHYQYLTAPQLKEVLAALAARIASGK